ncbi:MAG: type II toxin-antitoxin system mRNA interferase toxin, RelE/StbE family [Acidobacteria bacterium]|nr:MAG: type II toxin-antitoxin system mRNA interferase toxin, RelE/StbE family [Acidobacteriota bacterium]
MEYDVFILRRAQKELANLPKSNYERSRDAIAALSSNPRPAGCKKLSGREGWRIRSGDYRIIYEIDDRQRRITVLHVGHRKDVYS